MKKTQHTLYETHKAEHITLLPFTEKVCQFLVKMSTEIVLIRESDLKVCMSESLHHK